MATTNIFTIGNKITSNKTTCFEIIGVNEYRIACKDLLNGDFCVFTKTEHNFESIDTKTSLKLSLMEILMDSNISEKEKTNIKENMFIRINAFL